MDEDGRKLRDLNLEAADYLRTGLRVCAMVLNLFATNTIVIDIWFLQKSMSALLNAHSLILSKPKLILVY